MRPRRRNWLSIIFVVLAFLALAGCGSASPEDGGRTGGLAAYEGTELSGPASGFRLTDQRGAATALDDFRGRAVVLAFMDTRCDEVCPLTALELRVANRELGADASRVAFLGVNVNANFNTLEDAVAMTDRFHLDEIPSWRFLTGPIEDLAAVWAAYSIEVVPSAGPEEEDFTHTPGIFVIDEAGRLRWYLSTPLATVGLAAGWDGPALHELLTDKLRLLVAEAERR